MKVCHYSEFDDLLEGGIKSSIRQQRTMLDRTGVDYTTDPSEDHDLLHLNVVGPFSAYRQFRARRSGTPVVFQVHSTGEDFEGSFRGSDYLAPLVGRYVRFLYGRADRLATVAQYTADDLRSKGVDVPIEVVSNGVDTERLAGFEDIDDAKERYDVDDLAVVNLAHVFERKGVPDFVQVAEDHPDLSFRWFGEHYSSLLTPSSTSRWVERAPDNVRFTGFVEDVRDAFAVGDVFLFPSYAEHQPVSLLEALWAGLPIVLRDIPQFGWLEDGTHVLKADSVEEFSEHVGRLADDPDLRAELGENAHELATEHTLDAVGAQLEALYEQTLADAAE